VPCLIFFTVFAVWLTGVLATMQGAWIGAFKLIWAGAIAGVISRTAPPQPVQTSDPALPPLRRPLRPARPGGSSCAGCSGVPQPAAVVGRLSSAARLRQRCSGRTLPLPSPPLCPLHPVPCTLHTTPWYAGHRSSPTVPSLPYCKFRRARRSRWCRR
jgi:hypothetical protein